jgi:hypothetical protein
MSEKTNERSIQVYDVELWCSWPVLFPEYVGRIQASGTYAAVVCDGASGNGKGGICGGSSGWASSH